MFYLCSLKLIVENKGKSWKQYNNNILKEQ